MAKTRLDLQALLEGILGSRNVYYQPPENFKLKYPCIVYALNNIATEKADDINYLKNDRYSVTLIHRDPDNTIFRDIQDLRYCELDRTFIKDNLYHYIFTLFF